MDITTTRPKKFLTVDERLWAWPVSANESFGLAGGVAVAGPQSEAPTVRPGAGGVAKTDKVSSGLRALAVFGPVAAALLVGMGVPWMYAVITCAPTVIDLVLEVAIAWKKRRQKQINREAMHKKQVAETAVRDLQTSGTIDDEPLPLRPLWRARIEPGLPRWRTKPPRWSPPSAAANALGMLSPPTILMLWPFSDDTAQDDVYAYGWHEIGPILTLTHAESLPADVYDRYKWSQTVSVLRSLGELEEKLSELDRVPARRKKDFVDVETHAALQEQQEAINRFGQWKEAASTTGAGFLRPVVVGGSAKKADYFGYDIVPLIAHHDLWQCVIQHLVTKVDLVVVNLAGLPDRDDAVGAGLDYELELVLGWKPGPRVALIGSGRTPPGWLRKRVVQWSREEGHLETYLWHETGHDNGSVPLAAGVMTALRDRYYQEAG